MKYSFFLLVILLGYSSFQNDDQWDKNAGLILPYTENAVLESSSNQDKINAVLDRDTETSWQSGAPFPSNYIQRDDLNIFKKNSSISTSGSKLVKPENSFDADLNTFAEVNQINGEALLQLDFPKATFIQFLSIKAGNANDLQLEFILEGSRRVIEKTVKKEESYQLVRFEIGEKIKQIKCSSSASFQVFELAATKGLPTEYVQLDLGQSFPIGIINCRYWPGHGTARSVSLFISESGKKWDKVADLDPAGLQNIITDVEPERQARYIKVVYELEPKDWNKVYLWEISAFNRHGHYGPIPTAEPSTVNIKDMLGVNGIWGWGTNQYSDLLPPGQGPNLFNPVATHARSYHDLSWDIADPDHQVDFKKMALGKGTEVQWWLNWDKEYYSWLKNGLAVQATIQIHHFTDKDWNQPFESAYHYGSNFAKHFGTSEGNGLVCTFEAGNEPWKYEAELYKEILYGMAKGVKDADPEMEIFPCALQAADPSMEDTPIFKNYMGARLTAREASLVDGINIHAYSYINNTDGTRKAVHPEHPHSTFREIFNAIRFRDKNMAGKKIYLSEWGWDHAGGGEDCTHEVCVNEEEGAVYGIRGALMAQRLGIDRATWYFYANSDKNSSLYTRSGLTGTGRTGFKKKKSYIAFESLLHHCGNSFFQKTLKEDEEAWVYLMSDSTGKATHLVAWRPVALQDAKVKTITVKGNYEPEQIHRIDGEKNTGTSLPLPPYQNGELVLELDAVPLIIALKNK